MGQQIERPKLLPAITGVILVAIGGIASPQMALARGRDEATLHGRVLDGSGKGLPGVVLTLSHPSAEIPDRTAISGFDGAYTFTGLSPGEGYSLRASMASYATVLAGPLSLPEGRAVSLNVTLRPSSESQETIYVEGEGRIVDTARTRTSATFQGEFIEGLPLLGREFGDVLTLAPGVTDTDGDGNPNVRGARDTGLQIRLDGTNVTDPLTGYSGQEINLETIDEVEIITAGASAEYGRADGGFANVITKSGGNDLEGSFKVFYRSRFLDGDGSLNEDQLASQRAFPEFSDTRAFFTIGGPVVKDHLWYFTSLERLDREEPVRFGVGGGGLQTEEGWHAFGKITWQVDPVNKLAFQINDDPLEFGGNYIGFQIDPDSDFLVRTGGPILQAKWTAVISPQLLLETLVSRLNTGVAIIPLSSSFRAVEVATIEPSPGHISARLPCETVNCAQESALMVTKRGNRIGRRYEAPSTTTGPYYFSNDDSRLRTTLKADLAYTVEGWMGNHVIKGGFEFNEEQYDDSPITNPVVLDGTTDSTSKYGTVSNPLPPSIRFGPIFLQYSENSRQDLSASGEAAGAYLQDSWRPRPNLTLNLGLRFDSEEIDSTGYTFFEPLPEAREALRRFDILCNAAGPSCTLNRDPGRIGKGLTTGIIVPPPGDPALQFDRNHDGVIDLSSSAEGTVIKEPFTSFDERQSEVFTMSNRNVAPRISASWDPWADGKTRFFGTWSKYYDRLFLGTVTAEQEARRFTATWQASYVVDNQTGLPSGQVQPGSPSIPISDVSSINQIDRDLATPSTVEWSLGFERELAPEWSVSVTYVNRRGKDLLQDVDVNHITCLQFEEAYGVDPYDVCGDGGVLELDRFGQGTVGGGPPDPNDQTPPSSFGLPNGAPDLYVVNTDWNQILRTGNYNSSRYDSVDLVLRRRQHQKWQMDLSYTYSVARGDAESFKLLAGNDPWVSELATGYLDFDQRHVLKWQGLVSLSGNLILGGTVQWSSGFPYSIVERLSDEDDLGNVSGTRVFFPTGEKNDQRNEGQWTINARVEKRLTIGRSQVSAFVEAENITGADDLTIYSLQSDFGQGLDGSRRFGRRWEIGAAVYF